MNDEQATEIIAALKKIHSELRVLHHVTDITNKLLCTINPHPKIRTVGFESLEPVLGAQCGLGNNGFKDFLKQTLGETGCYNQANEGLTYPPVQKKLRAD